MKLTVSQSDLAKALDQVAPVASGMDIYRNVLLSADESGLSVTGGNDSLFLSVRGSAEVAESGAVALPAATLKNYVSNLPAGAVTLGGKDAGSFSVDSSAGSNAVLSGVAAEEYPAIPQVSFGGAELPMEDFQALIDWVIFAAAGEDVQPPTIGGVQLSVKDGSVTLTATDRFRLARATFPLSATPDRAYQAIVRPKFLAIARKVFRKDEVVSIGLSDAGSWLGFHQENADLMTQLVQGEYPDVSRFVPSSSSTTVIVDRQAMIQVTQRVVALANADTHSVRLKIEDGRIRFGVQSSGVGSAKDQISAEVQGEGMEVCINGRFLLDILNRVPGDRVFLGLTGPLKPILLQPESGALASAWALDYVLMPLRDNA